MDDSIITYEQLVHQLKSFAQAKNITHQQIADAAGLHRENVSRFFALKYSPTLDKFCKIAAACGVAITLQHQPSK